MNDKRHRSGSRGRNQRADNRPPFDFNQVVLAGDSLPPDLFSATAEDAAKHIAGRSDTQQRPGKYASRATQLRKFYDEICMWDNKVRLNPNDFDKQLPFILMLKAKVAYAKGRQHVEDAYQKLMNRCLDQVRENPDPQTLHNCKLFLEAFTGYYKVYGPSN